MNILIVSQNLIEANSLKASLNEYFSCYIKESTVDAIAFIDEKPIDLILMESEMPLYDGISALKVIKKKYNIPVYIMSERTDKDSVLFAYQAGCDDYIRKPIYNEELVFKIKKLFNVYDIKELEGIKIDTIKREITVDETLVKTTNKEYELLLYLVKHKGEAIKRESLLNDVWGYGFFGDDRTIDTHIKTLRKHLGKYKDFIKTIRGFGYKLEVSNG